MFICFTYRCFLENSFKPKILPKIRSNTCQKYEQMRFCLSKSYQILKNSVIYEMLLDCSGKYQDRCLDHRTLKTNQSTEVFVHTAHKDYLYSTELRSDHLGFVETVFHIHKCIICSLCIRAKFLLNIQCLLIGLKTPLNHFYKLYFKILCRIY